MCPVKHRKGFRYDMDTQGILYFLFHHLIIKQFKGICYGPGYIIFLIPEYYLPVLCTAHFQNIIDYPQELLSGNIYFLCILPVLIPCFIIIHHDPGKTEDCIQGCPDIV